MLPHVNRWVNLALLRKLSSESTRAAAVEAASFKHEPKNVFGTLSQSGRNRLARRVVEREITEDPAGYDKLEFDLEPRKNYYYYKYEIKNHSRQGKFGIRRALELFHEMKAKARLTPDLNNFSPLIYGCAKAGYTKRAFELYDELLKYHKKPTNSIVTCLINSCAESPFPDYGLQRLSWFLKHIKVEFNRTLNEIQYNSAIKAYGKLGRLDEASKLVQEMIDNNIYPSIDTLNMLLIGCASNKETGCTLALRIYKRIKMYDMKPNLITYRLLLRCIRDCDMGSPQLVAATINELPAVSSFSQRLNYQERIQKLKSKPGSRPAMAWAPLLSEMGKTFADAVQVPAQDELIASNQVNSASRDESKAASSSPNPPHQTKKLVPVDLSPAAVGTGHLEEMLPNLLSNDHLDLMRRIHAIQFDKLKRSSDRLMLFGGLHGYMAVMLKDGCKPDKKTFSLLLECLVPSRENYLEYFKLAQEVGIERDLVFYDLLIQHLCTRFRSGVRLELALHFVEQMQLDRLRPSIATFEGLAAGCRVWSEARKLISDVENCGFVVSEIMIARFFDAALERLDFGYLFELIQYSKRVGFRPNRRLVDKLEALRLRAHELILRQEQSAGAKKYFSDQKVDDYDRFRQQLGTWLKKVDLRQDEHPWSQFEVEHGSKNVRFREYAKQMQVASQAKREALEQGRPLGNLYERSRRQIEASK